MTAYQIYEQVARQLSTDDKMVLLRLIINDVVPEPVPAESPEDEPSVAA